MKIFLLFLLLLNMGFADEYKKLGLIYPKVNNNESVEEFAQLVNDSINNAIAEYNFSQNTTSKMYKIFGISTLSKNNPSDYINKKELQKVLLVNFSTKRAKWIINRCNNFCSFAVTFKLYSSDANLTKKIKYQYDGNTCELSDESTKKLNFDIAKLLNK